MLAALENEPNLYHVRQWNEFAVMLQQRSAATLARELVRQGPAANPTDDQTWDDLIATGKRLTSAEGAQKIWANNTPYYTPYWAVAYGGGWFDADATKVLITNPRTARVLTLLREMWDKYAIAPTPQENSEIGLLPLFATGRVAQFAGGTWGLPPFRAESFDWDLAEVPTLGHREFRLLWLSLLPGTLGMMMSMVAFGYVAYRLSGSTTTLAMVNAGWGVPMFCLSPLAGVVADRVPRRNVLLLTQGVVGATAVAAALLLASGTIQVWHLFLITVVQGTAFAFNVPARQALIAELVPRADLANALALYNAGLNLNRVAGPAIGGALLTLPAVGPGGVFASMAVLYLVVLAMLQRLPATPVPQHGGERIRRGTTLGQLMVGLRYVGGNAQLRALLLLAFLPLVFGMPYQGLRLAAARQPD